MNAILSHSHATSLCHRLYRSKPWEKSELRLKDPQPGARFPRPEGSNFPVYSLSFPTWKSRGLGGPAARLSRAAPLPAGHLHPSLSEIPDLSHKLPTGPRPRDTNLHPWVWIFKNLDWRFIFLFLLWESSVLAKSNWNLFPASTALGGASQGWEQS